MAHSGFKHLTRGLQLRRAFELVNQIERARGRWDSPRRTRRIELGTTIQWRQMNVLIDPLSDVEDEGDVEDVLSLGIDEFAEAANRGNQGGQRGQNDLEASRWRRIR